MVEGEDLAAAESVLDRMCTRKEEWRTVDIRFSRTYGRSTLAIVWGSHSVVKLSWRSLDKTMPFSSYILEISM